MNHRPAVVQERREASLWGSHAADLQDPRPSYVPDRTAMERRGPCMHACTYSHLMGLGTASSEQRWPNAYVAARACPPLPFLPDGMHAALYIQPPRYPCVRSAKQTNSFALWMIFTFVQYPMCIHLPTPNAYFFIIPHACLPLIKLPIKTQTFVTASLVEGRRECRK